MQTFLPYPEFDRCAQVLDNKRLGKQIVECRQILKAITDPSYGWQNHPAVNMWRGYHNYLWKYANSLELNRQCRGCAPHQSYLNLSRLYWSLDESCWDWVRPTWLGDPRLHSSHRSNLLRKDSIHYGQFGWTESPDLPYFWPSKAPEYQESA